VSSDVLLPQIAVALLPSWRLIVYGHINLLDRANFEAGDTAGVVVGSFRLLAQIQTGIPTVLFVDIPPSHPATIRKCLEGESESEAEAEAIIAVFCDLTSALLTEKMFVIGTTLDIRAHGPFLRDYLSKGGSLAVFCIDNDSALSFNDFLVDYGFFCFCICFCFPCCSFSDDRACSQMVSTMVPFEQAMQWVLPAMVGRLSQMAAAPPANDFALDNLVTAIRYYVRIPEYRDFPVLRRLVDCVWEYLQRTDYRTAGNLIVPKIAHAIAIVLLQELWDKLPFDPGVVHPDAELFPGASTAAVLEEWRVGVEMRDDQLISTGMWLNAGVLGHIECAETGGALQVQVGAHSRSLIVTPGPRHRCPSVCAGFALLHPSTPVDARPVPVRGHRLRRRPGRRRGSRRSGVQELLQAPDRGHRPAAVLRCHAAVRRALGGARDPVRDCDAGLPLPCFLVSGNSCK
jgi:hypothetical protein